MKKFSEISSLTQRFLSGNLVNLYMDYTDKDNIDVHIIYRDKIYKYDYEIIVHPNTNDIDFIKHKSEGYSIDASLPRNEYFELAIEDYVVQQNSKN